MTDDLSVQLVIALLTIAVFPFMAWVGKRYLDKSEERIGADSKAALETVRDLGARIDKRIAELGTHMDEREIEGLTKFLDIEKQFGRLPEQFMPRPELNEVIRGIRSGQDELKSDVKEVDRKLSSVHEATVKILATLKGSGHLD